mgnify:CR=1 FL=1
MSYNLKIMRTIKALQKFQHAIVAVDTVIFCVAENKLKILLIEMKRAPYTGKWAIPGGLVMPDESLEESVVRHLKTKTGLSGFYFEQLHAFGKVDRDYRGRVVSVAFLSLLSSDQVNLKTSADYADIKWFDVNRVPKLAYDHKEILATALLRLRARIGHTNVIGGLLPDKFTLSELQQAYELILGKTLDKRNFRKKILATKMLVETKEKFIGSFRPAVLYKFKDKKIKEVNIL